MVSETTYMPTSEDYPYTRKETEYLEKAEVNLNGGWTRCNPIEGTGLSTSFTVAALITIPSNIQIISNVIVSTRAYAYDPNGNEISLSS